MKFGIPLEIRPNEGRVGAVPFVVEELVKRGHQVYVETLAGDRSGFSDLDYEKSGGVVVPSSEKLYSLAEIILKVREPMPVEYDLIQPEHLLFAFFNFINNLDMTRAIMSRGCSCIAFEMLRSPDGSRPMMLVNGEIAGKLAIHQGMYYLENHKGRRGKLLGSIAGSEPARVVVIGAGTVGFNAAKIASALGADVFLLDKNHQKLQLANKLLPPNVHTLYSTETTFRKLFPKTDLLVTAIHIPDDRSPVIITRELVKLLPPGAVVVDVNIDRGGSLETSKPTNYDNPTFVIDDVVHFCVPNLAGVVPHTASPALSSALIPYLLQCSCATVAEIIQSSVELRNGLAIYEGHITNENLARALSVPFHQLQKPTP